MLRLLLFAGILALSVTIAFRLVHVRALPQAAPALVSATHAPSELLATASKELEQPAEHSRMSGKQETLSEAVCPLEMVFVAGESCAQLSRQCLRQGPQHCESYSTPAGCQVATRLTGFCIDRFEYPNIAGMLPAAMLHFEEAIRACKGEGKRLCTEAEWTFACEGAEHTAFSYGSEERPAACNFGPPVDAPQNWALFFSPTSAAEQVQKLDSRVPSGSLADCVSSAGVSDMLGNVAEWVASAHPDYAAGLRGGHFLQGSATCRTASNIRHRFIRYPFNGARCCADPLVPVSKSRPTEP